MPSGQPSKPLYNPEKRVSFLRLVILAQARTFLNRMRIRFSKWKPHLKQELPLAQE